MSTQIERAIQLYNEARFAEQQGNINRAEVLYMESKDIFLQEGGLYLMDAADTMNVLATMQEKHGDYGGALRAADKSIRILDDQFGKHPHQKADEIRWQACLIIGNIHGQLGRYEQAEQALQQALNYALNVFREDEEQTRLIRDQLATLYKYTGTLKEQETL